MKFTLKALAIALLALPAVAQAQTPFDNSVSVSILSHPFKAKGTGYPTNGEGGGFKADFSLDFPLASGPRTFADYLIWCIDANRGISVPGGPYTYQAFTALSFANTSFGSPSPNAHNVTVSDMRKIVTVVSDLRTNWTSYTKTQREDRQGSIWALFRGEPTVASLGTIAEAQGNLAQWVVLYNGRNQTFLTEVSEPSEVALLMTVIGGLMFLTIARRRRA